MTSAGLRFLETLRRTQWLDLAGLDRYQLPLLDRLLRHAATETDYYPERLAPLFNGGSPETAPIDFSRWQEIPILRRTHAIDFIEQLKARRAPPDTGASKAGSSSGTTGRPLQHWRSGVAIMAGNCTLDRTYEAFGMDLSGSLALITSDKARTCQYPDGGRFTGWNHVVPAAKMFVLAIETDPADQVEWLERVRPDHVMTYPVTLAELAGIAAEKGSSTRFRTFISGGEILTEQARDIIGRTFGCRVIDNYGAREIGTIAFECPSGGGFHVCSETVLCEIVDGEGRPVPAGEYGRVVVTPLYNYAMPFIRYDIGDYAVKSRAPCRCGRGLPLLDQIAGRTRNMFIMPDGSRRRLRGALVSEAAEYLSYRQIQLVQTELNTVEIRYVPHDATAAADQPALTRLLQREFHASVIVRLVPVGHINRGPGMKLEQLVSMVAA